MELVLIRQIALVLSLLLVGCRGDGAAEMSSTTCDYLEDEVVDMASGDIIKIVEAREIKRSVNILECRGLGYFSSGQNRSIKYHAWIDEDKQMIVAWDTRAADAAEWDRIVAEHDQELNDVAERLSQDINADIEAAWRSVR